MEIGGAAMAAKNRIQREAIQEKALEIVRENPSISMRELSLSLGLSKGTVWNWKKNNTNNFAERYKDAMKEAFENLEGSAIGALSDLIEERNFQAVKYTLDYCGFKPVEKQEVRQERTIINVTIDEGEE